MSTQRAFGFSLKFKLIAGLLISSVVTLAVAMVMIERTTGGFADASVEHAEKTRAIVDSSIRIYRQVQRGKRRFFAATVTGFALRSELQSVLRTRDPSIYDPLFDRLLRDIPELLLVELITQDGRIAYRRDKPGTSDAELATALALSEPLPGDIARLRMTFAQNTVAQQQWDRQLKATFDELAATDQARSRLPAGSLLAFLLVVGTTTILLTAAGIIVARRISNRIRTLITATKGVAGGSRLSRVEVSGNDEITVLGNAFNSMVEDLEKNEQQIAYLQRLGAWEDVARKLAHEIKNPLTPIQLAMQQCVSSYDGDDEKYQRLLRDANEIITEEIEGLKRLVDAFRTLGQLPKVEASPLALADVFGDLKKDPNLRSLLSVANTDDMRIRGDRLLLKRVFANLVENGIQAGTECERGGRVQITTRRDDSRDHVIILIDDEGPGLPPSRHKQIFEPYFTTKETGTGLGLAISKKIVLEHGGTLDVSPETPPLGGARMRLSLPLAGDQDTED